VLSWYAVQDFLSVDDARMLMESEARDNMVIGGQQLFLDYSSGPPVGSSGQGPAGPAGLDWICEMCSAVNFSRCTGQPSSRAVWSEAHVLCGY
jgi:RNA-binding protein 5/10